MPIYDYRCPGHGHFTDLVPLAEAALPAACPTCGTPAPRVIVAPSAIGRRHSSRMKAHAANERSSHEPQRVRSAPGTAPPARRHGGGPSRPWMIGH
jgi:putative FmdB family regulatory protein